MNCLAIGMFTRCITTSAYFSASSKSTGDGSNGNSSLAKSYPLVCKTMSDIQIMLLYLEGYVTATPKILGYIPFLCHG